MDAGGLVSQSCRNGRPENWFFLVLVAHLLAQGSLVLQKVEAKHWCFGLSEAKSVELYLILKSWRPKHLMLWGPSEAQKLPRENWKQGEDDLECEMFLDENLILDIFTFAEA